MRILNRRIAAFSAAALMTGVFIGGLVIDNIILLISIPVALTAIGVLFLCKKFPTLFAVYLCLAVGIAAFAIDYTVYKGTETAGYYEIEARIEKVGNGYYLADDVRLDGKSCVGKIKINYDKELDSGDEVYLYGAVETLDVNITDSYSSWLFAKKVRYETDAETVNVVSVNKTVFEKIRDRITAPMEKFMSTDDAGIAKSLIFGDKSDLSVKDNEIIRGTGLSHIFALSGLHVGFLMAIVVFLSKKLKASPVVTLVVSVAVLAVYGFVTGFPSGLKRAAVMTILCLIAPMAKAKNDALNTLGAACFVIILTNPRELFDLSFLMSAAAVFGIALFYKPFSAFFTGKKGGELRKFLGEGTALTLSSNAALFPICCNVFGSIAVYSVVANLIILPLVSFTFTLLAVSAILTFVFSGFGVLYYLVQFPIIAVRIICGFIYSLPYATVSVTSLGISSVFYVAAIVVCSRFVKLKFTPKIITVCVLAALWAVAFIVF